MTFTIQDADSTRTARLKLIYLAPLALVVGFVVGIYDFTKEFAEAYRVGVKSVWNHVPSSF